MLEEFTHIKVKSYNPTQVLLILIQSIKANLNFKAVAALLNANQLVTASGLVWTEFHVKGVLSRLRRHQSTPTSLYRDLTRLIAAGVVKTSDAALLLMPQKRGRK